MEFLGSSLPISTLLPVISSALVISLLIYLYNQAYGTDIPHISGIPEAPGAVPFYGHLKVLGDDHPTQFEQWGIENDWPVIQARFGTRRVLVLNTFQAAQHFIVKNATATIDRPLFWTFHKILSSTQGGTVGTAPWNETTKRRRTVVSAYMTRPAIQNSAPMLDVESRSLVNDMYRAGNGGTADVVPALYFKRMALNVAMMICYGSRFDDISDPLLLKVLRVAETVSTFRSTNKNFADYVPLLRYLPKSARSTLAAETRKIRDDWLESLFSNVRTAISKGKAKPCITESLINESGKGQSKLTLDDVKSINVSLVSGGFETVATTGLACLGLLTTAEGQRIQDRAFQDLLATYAGSVEKAWDMVITEEKSEYVVAMVREMLRYFAAIQFLPPRQTYKEFMYGDVKIPKGVSVYLNAQAINHSKETYGPDADLFRPERWLPSDKSNLVPPCPAPYHYSYGAGSRACPAIALTNRILYANFARLILLYRVLPSPESEEPFDTSYVSYNVDTTLATCQVKPYAVRLEKREQKDQGLVERLLGRDSQV